MVNGAIWRDSLISAANAVAEHKYELNEINVFPVPDGDTGANMAVTLGGAKQMVKCLPDHCSAGEAAGTAAAAMLRGSRGNSGAILALLFRGIARGLANHETFGAAELVLALDLGVKTAYGAVTKPTEGTILTAARECVARGEIYLRRKPTASAFDMIDFMAFVAKETLKKTPEMLDVLAEEEVVDAGAKGFWYMLEAMAFTLGGRGIWPEPESEDDADEHREEAFVFMAENVTGDLTKGIPVTYRVTFEVDVSDYIRQYPEMVSENSVAERLRECLQSIGTSVVVVEQNGAARCQAFVDDLNAAFDFAKATGGMIYFLGTAHGLTRKVQFETPKLREDGENMQLRYPYCTEVLWIKDVDAEGAFGELYEQLKQIGDSAVVIDGEDMVKCHVHTDMPEAVLKDEIRGSDTGGYLVEIKVENMERSALKKAITK